MGGIRIFQGRVYMVYFLAFRTIKKNWQSNIYGVFKGPILKKTRVFFYNNIKNTILQSTVMVSLISPLIKKKFFGTIRKKNMPRAFYGILWCCL